MIFIRLFDLKKTGLIQINSDLNDPKLIARYYLFYFIPGYPWRMNSNVTYQLRIQHDSGTIEDEVSLNENFLAKLFNLLTDISKSVPLLSTSENFETFFVPAGVLMIQHLNGQDALYQNSEFICNVHGNDLTLYYKEGSKN